MASALYNSTNELSANPYLYRQEEKKGISEITSPLTYLETSSALTILEVTRATPPTDLRAIL